MDESSQPNGGHDATRATGDNATQTHHSSDGKAGFPNGSVDAEKGHFEAHDEIAASKETDNGEGYTEAEEKRMVWKTDIRVISIVFLLYMFAFLDVGVAFVLC